MTIQVSASLPDASPETMACSVGSRWSGGSRKFRHLANELDEAAQLDCDHDRFPNRSIDGAPDDIRVAISAAGGQLPKSLHSPGDLP